jgi:tetratricopeptide (TPR) repeat protein
MTMAGEQRVGKRTPRAAGFAFLAALALAWAAAALAAQETEQTAPPDESPHARFFEAGKAYRAQDFEKARELYGFLVQEGAATGAVWYNLGNTLYRAGDLGRAVLCYERARLFIPRDPDLDFNLRYVKDQRADAEPKETGAAQWLTDWLACASGSEVLAAVLVVNALFFAALAVQFWARKEWTYTLALALAIVWAPGLALGGVKWRILADDNRGVVVARELEVRAGPDPQDKVLFTLHAGSMVTWERNEGDWRLIRFSEERRGWAPAAGVELVRLLR